MRTKRVISLLLAVITLVGLVSGCKGEEKTDENTLTINLGIRNVEMLIDGLTKKFPDIDFKIEPTYCANPSSYLLKTLVTGNSSDIFYYTHKPDMADAGEYLLDLSSYDFISRYDRSVINSYVEGGHIYCVPGPLVLRGVAYNKTLFEQNGWKKPESHKELVALCKKIRAEKSDITPIAMSCGGVAYPFSLVTTLSQAGFLGTPAGEEWEKRFKAGEASVAEGWGEGLEMTAELIDAGAFSIKDYIGVWDGDACKMDFASGRAAMFIMWAGQADMLEMIEENEEYEFAFMPFYGKEDGELTIGANTSFVWGVSKRLGQAGNEKKLENALRVMEWLATPEAQELMKTYITDENGRLIPTMAEISPLAAAKDDADSSPYFRELWEQAAKGNKMNMIYSGYESVIINAGNIVQEAMAAGKSGDMKEKFIASVDSDYKDHLSGGEAAVLCEVTENFTEAETAQLLANGINEAGLGDFTLLTHTGRAAPYIENKIGAGARYYKGTLSSQDYNTVLGSLKNLQTLSLTGSRVKQLLSSGKRVYSSDDETKYADFPYYWAGIDVKLGKDGAAASVKLQGKELDDDAVYKVVFISGDYTDEISEAGTPVDTDENISEFWFKYISSKKKISPPEVLR